MKQSVYDRLYREIRMIDPETIIIMESIWDMHLPDPMYVHNGHLDINVRYSGKTVPWDKNLMYSMHVYDSSRDGFEGRVRELTQARKNWGVGVHIGEFNNDGQGHQYDAYRLYNDNKINWNMWTYKIGGANMGNWSLFQSPYKSNANPMTDSFETIRKSRWGDSIRTFRQGTNTLINDFSETEMYDIYSSGQRHRITGVIYSSNQSGFPLGGASGPILADDNDTGSGLVTDGSVSRNALSVPVINPATSTFNSAGRQNVTITGAAADAVIHYTVNGLTPTRDSPRYTGAFSVELIADQTVIIRARAFTDDGVAAPTVYAAYAVGKTSVPSFSNNEAWPSAPFNLVISAQSGAEIWYSLNGGDFTLYSGPVNIASSVTVTAYAIRSGMSKSESSARIYKFGTPPKTYHTFRDLNGVRANEETQIAAAASDWEYSLNGRAAAMTVMRPGMPGAGERSVTILPEGGGVFETAGYNYLIIVFKDPGNNSFWINFNRSPAGSNSGWSDNANIAAVPSSSIAGQWVMSAIPIANAGARINSIIFGQYNAGTYLIDSIYLAVNADDPPRR